MTVFTDTSALYAIMDADDTHHEEAKDIWFRYLDHHADFVCHNYILIETIALLQNRIGMDSVTTFVHDVLPVIHLEWITPDLHHTGLPLKFV